MSNMKGTTISAATTDKTTDNTTIDEVKSNIPSKPLTTQDAVASPAVPCCTPPPGRIVCIGMCVLDIIHVCEEFPQEDTDKRCLSGYWQRGGNASNNCTVLRRLGADCDFLGMLSDSPAFGFLLEDCRKRGINIENCPRTAQDPPFSSVILVQSGDSRTIIHSNANFPILTHAHFRQLSLADYGWLHFEARNPQETLPMLKDIWRFNEQNQRKIHISVELEKLRIENLVLAQWADYVFLGKDLAQHLGWSDAKSAVFGLRRQLLATATHKPALICTWGAAGSSCLSADDVYQHLAPAPPRLVVDSLGAGDTFCAATIFALHHGGKELKDAVAFGNRCAGYKLGYRGYDAVADLVAAEKSTR